MRQETEIRPRHCDVCGTLVLAEVYMCTIDEGEYWLCSSECLRELADALQPDEERNDDD